MVQAVKKLPQQQQLLICAATKLLGGHKQEPASSAANQPTTSGLSGLPRQVSFEAVDGKQPPPPALSCALDCAVCRQNKASLQPVGCVIGNRQSRLLTALQSKVGCKVAGKVDRKAVV